MLSSASSTKDRRVAHTGLPAATRCWRPNADAQLTGTSVNLFTDWEVHGQRQGTNNTYKTPGQAFTDEWGIGQILPLKKDFSKLLQLGVIGYDQLASNR